MFILLLFSIGFVDDKAGVVEVSATTLDKARFFVREQSHAGSAKDVCNALKIIGEQGDKRDIQLLMSLRRDMRPYLKGQAWAHPRERMGAVVVARVSDIAVWSALKLAAIESRSGYVHSLDVAQLVFWVEGDGDLVELPCWVEEKERDRAVEKAWGAIDEYAKKK